LSTKVTFNGSTKRIVVNSGESSIDIKLDVYSAWKDWVLLSDNSKYQPAIRVTGGDPIGGGLYTGDVYFLINNWRIEFSEPCEVSGVIYSDDYPSPFIAASGTNIVTNKVSSLVQTVSTAGGSGATAAEVWDYLIANADTPGSIGERITKLLTVAKFLGLK